jgi:hypothetical protein
MDQQPQQQKQKPVKKAIYLAILVIFAALILIAFLRLAA